MVVIQATSPFTTAHDLAAVVDALAQHPAAACALTSVRVPPATAFVLREVDDGVGRFLDNSLVALRTQDVPPLSIPTGAAYASWIDRLRAGEPLVAEPVAVVVVDEERALDIDDEDDLRRARARCAP
jgi:CMP-N-acetylneuraminic acid synthetase